MAQLKTRPEEGVMQSKQQKTLTNGLAAAAMLAAGLACLTLGLLTTLVAAFPFLATVLQWYHPAGALSGTSTLTVVAWLISWFILAQLWQHKQVHFTKTAVVTLVLIVLGLAGTFPPFLGLFAR